MNLKLCLTLVLCASLIFPSCTTAGIPMGAMGKTKAETHVKVQQAATTDAAGNIIPGESYEYSRKIELPAGVDIEGKDSFHAGINEGGDWDLAVNGEGKASTQGEAALIANVSANNAALGAAIAKSIMEGLPGLLSGLAGLQGVKEAGNTARTQAVVDGVVRGAEIVRPKPTTGVITGTFPAIPVGPAGPLEPVTP